MAGIMNHDWNDKGEFAYDICTTERKALMVRNARKGSDTDDRTTTVVI